MPGQPAVLTDERDQLLAFIAQQRDGLRFAAFGLSDEQARLTSTAGVLSVGGLIVHVTEMERGWVDLILCQPQQGGQDDYADGFRLAEDRSLAQALEELDRVAARTEQVVRSIDDLNQAVPVPQGVPWYPQDLDAWTVRWVLLHLIEEIGRHAGHADIVRESIDGATMFELMAGAEGWPATEWLTPWTPDTHDAHA